MESEIKSRESLQSLIEKEKAVIVYFYSDRCSPCISLRPKVIDMVKTAFQGVRLVFVNSEKVPEVAAAFSVFANPAIIVFIEGREYRRYSKYISINELGSDIERVYRMVF